MENLQRNKNMRQITIQDTVTVNASVNKVWEAIKNPVSHAEWHPMVTRISGEHKLGAVRKCDVNVGNKPGYTEERCSVYDEGRKIIWSIEKDSTGFSRMVSNWTAGFSLKQSGSAILVTAESNFQPRNFFVRLMMPMIKSKFHKTQQTILNSLKQFVEK